MATQKKRSRSPEEEDLAAAVGEMINSPITRPNLPSLLGLGPRTATEAAAVQDEESGGRKTTIVEGTIVPLTKAGEADTKEIPTPEETTIVEPTMVDSSRPVPKVHACGSVRQGHGAGEHALYLVLWSVGKPESEDVRRVEASLVRLAARAGVTVKNLQSLLRRLEQKKTIELVKRFSYAAKTPNAYRVYSEREILRRRREAGLEYVIRNKGVQFLPPAEALRLLQARREREEAYFAPTTEETTIVDSTTEQ